MGTKRRLRGLTKITPRRQKILTGDNDWKYEYPSDYICNTQRYRYSRIYKINHRRKKGNKNG